MAATTALREALNQGISSGSFIDTKIILYSRRDSSGRVSQPKALYANSQRFEVLFGNFAESQSKDFKEAINEEETAEDYGCLSDSDLEDDDEEKTTSPKNPSEPKGAGSGTPDPVSLFFGAGKTLCEEQEECVDKGKVVKIPDIAFVT